MGFACRRIAVGDGILLTVQKPGIAPFYASFGVMVAGGLCLAIWLALLVPTIKINGSNTDVSRGNAGDPYDKGTEK